MPATSFYQTVRDYTTPPDKETTCSGPKLTYNNNYDATNTSLNQLRQTDCLSEDTKYAEELEREMAEKTTLVDAYTKQNDLFTSYIDAVRVLQSAKGPFDTYMSELDTEQKTLESEYTSLQQKIRAGRRRFIDSEPQSGVKSVLGLQTADDKVLLAFWICFAVGIIAVEILIMRKYGDILQILTLQQKVAVFLVVLALCMGIAHYFIRTYA
jgi:hypothetical protein